jgi:hypothetical protein
VLDTAVLPGALDEIGMSGDRGASPKLIQMVEEGLDRPEEPYLCIKAIEALGRLRESSASPLLRPLLEAKRVWRWQHPRELRITVAQAMQKIDPEWARSFLPTSGLSHTELVLPPLDPVATTPWLRQRRYERIKLPRAVAGIITTPQGEFQIAIEEVSLGGGVAQSKRQFKPGTLTAVQLRSGWRRVQAQVFMRESRPQQLTFELVNIGLDDRTQLRRSLARLHV